MIIDNLIEENLFVFFITAVLLAVWILIMIYMSYKSIKSKE